MKDSVALFFALSTQWRWVTLGQFGAMRTGLEYTAINPTAANLGIEMTPLVFDDIQTLERAALSFWNEKRG